MRRLVNSILIGAVSGLAFASPTAAQLGGWSLSVNAEGGVNIPLRQLGKNVGTILGQEGNLQIVAERESSPMVGGGLLLTSPSGETLFRARFVTTLDGEVTGQVGVCEVPDTQFDGLPFCQPVVNTAGVRAFSVDAGFLQGSPGDAVRASLHLGLGLRQFSFGELPCVGNEAWEPVCDATVEIWQDDGGISPFILAGVRLNGELGPATLWVEGIDRVGRYGGGSDRADGNIQNDVSITAGLALRIF
ncbi:MAG: hypothetical protein KJO11_06930 [Gemmatimonadetes bacterium]|nr:hypothetical protein [Gemmatimonadota bacterium]NNF38999.1 hypothetical protein [Gemmatimonadota bacterium]